MTCTSAGHVWTWGSSSAGGNAAPPHLACQCGRYTAAQANDLLRRAEEAEARVEALRTEIRTRLEAMEWREERTMSGKMRPFCPVCGGTPSVYRANPHTARPDGHWLSGSNLPEGGCPLAQVLDMVRDAPAPGEIDDGSTRGGAELLAVVNAACDLVDAASDVGGEGPMPFGEWQALRKAVRALVDGQEGG